MMIVPWAALALAVLAGGAWCQDHWPVSPVARTAALMCGAWFAGVLGALLLLQ